MFMEDELSAGSWRRLRRFGNPKRELRRKRRSFTPPIAADPAL